MVYSYNKYTATKEQNSAKYSSMHGSYPHEVVCEPPPPIYIKFNGVDPGRDMMKPSGMPVIANLKKSDYTFPFIK